MGVREAAGKPRRRQRAGKKFWGRDEAAEGEEAAEGKEAAEGEEAAV